MRRVGPSAPFVRLNPITEIMPGPRYISNRGLSMRPGVVNVKMPRCDLKTRTVGTVLAYLLLVSDSTKNNF